MMQRIELRIGLMALTIVALTIVALAAALVGVWSDRLTARAQDGGGTCAEIAADALAQAQRACGDVETGAACFGYAGASASVAGSVSADFAAPGDTIALADVDALTTSADPAAGDWGVARVQLAAGLPEGAAVTGVLFGEGAIARPAAVPSDRPTMTVTNFGSAEANLRGGAGVTYPVAGTLAGGASAVADGRNEQGDWVRIQTEDGVAWIFARLIEWDGDLSTLDVLLPTDVTPPFEVSAPFEAFTLRTGAAESACADVPAGLLLQLSGEDEASLSVNGVELRFSNASLLLHATPNGALDVMALDGAASVVARGATVEVEGGEMTRVTLGGEDGLVAATEPGNPQSFAAAEVALTPLALLPGDLTCRVSAPANASEVTLRVGPGEQRGVLAAMRAGVSYAVLGWAEDGEGTPWFELDTGAQTSWVRQDAVDRFGTCDAVAQVEAPPLVFAAPSAPQGDAAADDVDDLAPAANTVWQMYPGTDRMSGTCSGAPAINFCDHLAAISPASGGIMWKGMEASPYYLQRIQPNVYAYAGPNVLGTGTINMTLRFTAEGTLTMTQSLVLSSEPECTHTYYYTGEKNW